MRVNGASRAAWRVPNGLKFSITILNNILIRAHFASRKGHPAFLNPAIQRFDVLYHAIGCAGQPRCRL
jgi:hypothetical protein